MSIKFNSAVTKLSGAAPWTLATVVVNDKPIFLYAYGMTAGDKVCVRRIVNGGEQSGFTNAGCSTNQPVPGAVVARSDLDACGNPVCMELGKLSIQLAEPGEYELVGTGAGFAAGTIIIEERVWIGSHDPAQCPKPLCPVPVVYCPSLRLSCSGEPGFGYHADDPKDPAATVEMAPCAGDPQDSIWIYPTSGTGHTVKVTDCDGVLIGYAANRSDCAPDCGCA